MPRSVINEFESLSWNYRSNCLCYFGKKIIVESVVRYDRWGFHFSRGSRSNQLVDLERMLHLLDGKSVPDNRADIASRLDSRVSQHGKSAKD
ncbi:Z1226 protein [Cronobacter condimenti 1330]|uniref:Z1226 protein n=1 Tax=Cronobacter condimenti 1330 TaxID=1073999 RepID=K7ZYH9_9ENTR|nr:Z1226 protein [Cronobacter condimenti 1330]